MLDSVSNDRELVSVIITAFNEEKFISQAIESLLCQSYDPIEVVIVNDGSTDKTSQVINKYSCKFENVKVVNLSRNCGKATAQNAAFEQCLGKYIAILGGDDYSVHSRIHTQVDYLLKNQFSFVGSNSYMVDENNLCLLHYPVFFKHPPEAITLARTFKGAGFPGGSILFTRELAEKIYPLPTNLPYEDLWFSFIAALYGRIGYLHEPLTYYRQHSNNTYGLFKKMKFSDFKERYIFLRKRLLPYQEEMRQYLLTQGLWNKAIQSSYEYARTTLEIQLESNIFYRFRSCFSLLFKYKNVMSFRELATCLLPNSMLMLRFLRLMAKF